MTTSTAPSSNGSNGSLHSNVVPSEVGWQFVPQYYTFVNKEPHRLHCFYNKSSTFIHGTEGEDCQPCFGQQEIHKKITSIGFQDCKVFIHSVDAQSSANGGIIIQVIGEMSNQNEPWRKFVQTFFLAEQPNGYFVLNDIFRFLKEETVEGDELSDAGEVAEAAAPAVPESPSAVVAPVAEPVYEPPREPTPPPAPVPEPVQAAPVVHEAPTKEVEEPVVAPAPVLETPAPAPVATPQTNGIALPEAEKPAPSAEKSREPTPAPPAQQQPAPVPAPPAVAATPSISAPAAPAATQAAPPVPAPAPAPSAPRSWASLAATNQKKWGSVAQESRGITETPSSPATSSGAQTPAQAHPQSRPQHGGPPRHDHPLLVAAQSVSSAHCFIKGVTEPISQNALASHLTQHFGPIKEAEIVRSKACAFVEFQTVESAKRAIVSSLNQSQGGEGGVYIEAGEGGPIRVFIETKKERGDRPPPSGGPRRGGAPIGGEARGGGGAFRGGRGGRGRGGPPPAK